MNIAHDNYPDAGRYVEIWRTVRALARKNPGVMVSLYFGDRRPASQAHQEFVKALHWRITIRGDDYYRGKKDSDEYLHRLEADRRRLQDPALRRAGRFGLHRFDTREVRDRFPQLDAVDLEE